MGRHVSVSGRWLFRAIVLGSSVGNIAYLALKTLLAMNGLSLSCMLPRYVEDRWVLDKIGIGIENKNRWNAGIATKRWRGLWSRTRGYLIAAALVSLAFLARAELSDSLEARPLLIVFIIPIMLSSYFGGWSAGFLAMVLSAFGSAYFPSPPDFLTNDQRTFDYVHWGLLWASGMTICVFTAKFHRTLRKARQARELQMQLSGLLDQAVSVANFGIFEHDLTTDIIRHSKLADEILEWDSREPLTLDQLTERLHPDDRKIMGEEMQRSQDPKGDGRFQQEYRLVLPGNRVRWVRVHAQTYFAGSIENRYPIRTVGTIFDITKAKEKQEELEQTLSCLEVEKSKVEEQAKEEVRLRQQAEVAVRMKDEFLAKATHELRTPLSVVAGWLGVLRSGILPYDELPTVLDTLERNINLELQLVEDILDISRVRRGKLEISQRTISLNEVLKHAVETIRFPAQQKKISIEVKLDEHQAAVRGDERRLEQIVWNLLTNAVKFTPRGGKVSIELERGDGVAIIRVSDTGIGINPGFLAHIFQAFEQQDSSITRQYGGLGLGLSIVKELTELHGGTIKAESEGENKGSTFIVTLPMTPVVAVPAVRDQSVLGDTGTAELKGKTILLVDDMPEVLAILSIMIKQTGANIIAASSAREALEMIQNHHPDIMLSDISMPGQTGYDLIREIRKLPSEMGGKTPAIVLSAHSSAEFREQALRDGYNDFLTKPASLPDLMNTIKAAIAG